MIVTKRRRRRQRDAAISFKTAALAEISGQGLRMNGILRKQMLAAMKR
jgi:hypothetical protein